MSEVSLVVMIEAGQVRSLVGLAFQIPLPSSLVWGPKVLPAIEANGVETEVWPHDHQLLSAVVIDRDARRLLRAGASYDFDTPYQLTLLDRMLQSAWPDFRVGQVELNGEAIATAAGIDPPEIDPGLARRLMSSVMGDFGDDEEDGDYDDAVPGDDFRQLATQKPTFDPDESLDVFEDHDWWVSVRSSPDEPFHHYQGNFVLQTFTESGPDVIQQLGQLSETALPDERETTRGLVVDASTKTLNMWLHPRGVSAHQNFGDQWSDWTIDHWLGNGFRRQLEFTGESDRVIPPSDLQVLSQFVPNLVEQLNLSEMMGEIKSSFRGFVRKGFGCLAFMLAIPALIASAVVGSWKGPFAFAGTVWLIVLIAYLVIARKMKRNFASMSAMHIDPTKKLPKLAPESKDDRIQIIDAVLADAGLPRYSQIQACVEHDDDDDIEPIMNVNDE